LRDHAAGAWIPVRLTVRHLRSAPAPLLLLMAHDRRSEPPVPLESDSETRHRLLWQRNVAGVVRATLDGRVLDCNDSFARTLGYPTRDVMLTHSTKEFYFDLDVRERFLARLRADHVLTNYELCLRRTDGTPVWILENVTLLREGNDEVLEATIIDITERKRVEEALRASEARYRTLINHLDQAIFLKDRDLKYVTVNPVFCADLGLAEEDLRGQTAHVLLPARFTPQLIQKHRAIEEQVLRECRPIQTEDTFLVRGKPRSIRINRTPVKDGADNVVGVLGIAWDVTEQRALEEQVRHVHKMDAIGQLAGGIAHDFNNLLTIMLGNLSFILNQPNDLPTVLDLVRNAEKAGLRAAELTRTLLGFARRTVLTTVPFDLHQAIGEVLQMIRTTIPTAIALETHMQPDLWYVEADPGQINQVLTNLTLNARDAMPDGGAIIYRTSHFVPDADYLATHVEARPGEFVRLRVQDTGVGIPSAHRQHIFEPFFTTKDKSKGTGLGLAIVFGIVKQHNGWIVCESEPGRGSCFDIFLPRCRRSIDSHSAPPQHAPHPATPDTILLVDDEAMIRQLGKTILTRAGYQVLLAENGLQAVDIFRTHRDQIALVILDAIMPRLSGRDTLRELARLHPGVCVLFSSGFSTEQLSALEFPQVRGVLPKPYRAEQLLEKVRDILEQSRHGFI
jgi:PAS domain S-box-containing protein